MTPHTAHHHSTHQPDAPSSQRGHPVLRFLAGAGGLIVVALVLWWSGKALPPPSSLDERELTDWLGGTDPVVAAFALVRLAGLAVTGWIAVTGAVSLVVHLSRLRRVRWLRRLIDRLCLPVVRRLVHGVAGVTLAATTMAPGAAGALPTTATPAGLLRPDTATILTIDAGPPLTAPILAGDRAVVVSLDLTGPEPPTSTVGSTPTPAPPTTAAESPAGAVPPPEAGSTGDDPGRVTDTWEIRAGDHLWHVARVTMLDRTGSTPSDDDVSAYLAVLIETNRERLLVATNPDLVFAGQVIALPPVPTTTSR